MIMQLVEFKNYLSREYPQSKTGLNYLERLTNFFSKYSEFNQENIDNYLTALSNENKLNAQKMAMYAFRTYSKFSGIEIKLGKVPHISTPEKDILTFKEIENEILPYFPSLFGDDAKKRVLLFRFMILSMLRISEVLALKKENFLFDDNIIRVVNGKGRKNRNVPIHKKIKAELQEYVSNSINDLVFEKDRSFILNIVDVINNKLRYKKHLTPHLLRKAGAKAYYKQTKDLEALSKILGHKSIQTTQIYIAYNIDDVKESFKNFKYPTRRKK
ncbi:MAG: site-specific integrase [Patescibacteria group bacterium]